MGRRRPRRQAGCSRAAQREFFFFVGTLCGGMLADCARRSAKESLAKTSKFLTIPPPISESEADDDEEDEEDEVEETPMPSRIRHQPLPEPVQEYSMAVSENDEEDADEVDDLL